MEADNLNVVVARIYEASLDPKGLDGLAGIVASALGSESGFIALLDRPKPRQMAAPAIVGLPSATSNFDEWARTAYADHYHACNIWFGAGVKRGFPAIVLGDELVARDEFLRSEWYEYCQRLEAFHVLGAQFHITDQLSGQFGAHLPRSSRAFDERSRQRMSLLLPHLQRALQIQLRLGVAEAIHTISADLLERLGVAFLVLDADRRVLSWNALAERTLAKGMPLRMTNGRVEVLGASAAMFHSAVQKAARTSAGGGLGSGGIIHLSIKGGIRLRLLVSPLPANRCPFGTSSPAVLVVVDNPAAGRASPRSHSTSVEDLRAAFGLTIAEATLLAAFAAGETLATYAAHSGISIETARTHTKRILSKSGYHRQVDLVRAIASDPMFRFSHTINEPAETETL